MELVESARSGAVVPWLVLDGYHFTSDYQRAMRDSGLRLLIIDDYNHQPRYHADVLLNQNLGAERFQYVCDSDTVLLLGTKYALLRKEFSILEGQRPEVTKVARKILVTLGGADRDNVMLKVFRALKLSNIRDLEARIVVGPANPHGEKLQEEVRRNQNLNGKFQIVQDGCHPS
jgi:spore coat polysaccharide biosynthesis predicted glycosyltransferase SpsG